jgi:hypothetical protein
MGECNDNHDYSPALSDGRIVNVMYAYDALMTSVLQGRGLTHARCLQCGDEITHFLDPVGFRVSLKLDVYETNLPRSTPPRDRAPRVLSASLL